MICGYTNQTFRARYAGDRRGGLINLGPAVDTKPSRVVKALAVQTDKQEPNTRIANDVAEAAIHPVTVIVGPSHDVFADHTHEAWVSSLERAIDAFRSGCRQKEKWRTLDEFAIWLVKCCPHSIGC